MNKIIIIGGGAAGIFAAIRFAQTRPASKVIVLEQSQKLLSKVKISGGGRCNVTHGCFDPAELASHYPRGNKELRGPFMRFQPRDTIEWFAERGVFLKTEDDGRMFPGTNDSQTIIDALLKAAAQAGVSIQCGAKAAQITREKNQFCIHLAKGDRILASRCLLATGSSRFGYQLAKSLGHTIIDPVPSLFTFNVPNSPLCHLAGVSVDEVQVMLPNRMKQKGPFLITHWGFSGPAVLKLSAWAARDLFTMDYQTDFMIDWVPRFSFDGLAKLIDDKKSQKSLQNDPLVSLPKNLWSALLEIWGLDKTKKWSLFSKRDRELIMRGMKQTVFKMSGKTTYKQEFVTCGGVKLSEVDFKAMESKLIPGLYFAGEVLDIDGVTGGFNFQAAWTTGWIAGSKDQC